ncbi:MAG: type II secretion system F family protein [Thermomicrobiales bacterium]|nr:type II secretion system F family protein [Thermomicrobiales bacterium]
MTSQMMIIVIGLLGASLTMLGLSRQRRSVVNIDERLANFADRPVTLEERELSQPFSERMLKPLIKSWSLWLGSRSPSKSSEKVRLKLARAGNPSGMGVNEFMGLRILVALGLGLGTLLFLMVVAGNPSMAFFLGPIFGIFGFLLPGIWLDRKIKGRRKEIIKALPDAIDLLTISVEAGLGFDPALMRVAEKWDNALTREFARVLSEMRIGKTKREALREMSMRVDEDGLTSFVSSVIQADQLGVAITHVLRIQSEAMRMKRRQRAEAAAQKAPLKMLFPMIFLIFPALYVVILGPAVPQIMEAF